MKEKLYTAITEACGRASLAKKETTEAMNVKLQADSTQHGAHFELLIKPQNYVVP
jgi:hypothetical protein